MFQFHFYVLLMSDPKSGSASQCAAGVLAASVPTKKMFKSPVFIDESRTPTPGLVHH